MLEATKVVDGGAGVLNLIVLHLIKNYSGDVMKFQMAGEMARDEGISVDSVISDDEVAVKDSPYTEGRGACLGERSIGHQVSGATFTYLLSRVWAIWPRTESKAEEAFEPPLRSGHCPWKPRGSRVFSSIGPRTWCPRPV